LLLGYFFLLRRSEYRYIDGKWSNFCLQLGNISFLTQDGQPCLPRKAKIVGIRLTGAKTNQYGREERRFQHRSGHSTLCPVKAVRWILRAATALRTRDNEPALSLGSGRGITSSEVTKIIKAGAAADGQDPEKFSTHSVRVGGATALLNNGADRLVIKLLGRWLSNSFEPYPVLTAEGTAQISRFMC
jgi:hypothetical protein